VNASEHVRWWAYRWPETWGARVVAWYCIAMALGCSMLSPRPIALPAAAAILVFVWLWGRTSAVAIGLGDEHLYLRRLLLGRTERIPLSEIRGCLVLRGLLRTRLRIYGRWRLWVTMEHGPRLLGCAVRDWSSLLYSLEAVFQPLGKWQYLERWWD
jgi:hypothetical protein